ncbi:hypothetical protein HY522_05480, partial [bacterium]|nr:hypothetical protein [bacterium]
MNTFIAGHLQEVLERGASILNAWRRQKLSLRRRAKNFETWLLVELVHQLSESGIASDEIQTNGLVDRLPLRAVGLASRLQGPKRNSSTLSPDLSIRSKTHGIVDVELKTGGSHADIMDDLEVVRFYFENGRSRPEFAWVVLIPEDAGLYAAVEKGMDAILDKARRRGIILNFQEIRDCDWLRFAVWTPSGQVSAAAIDSGLRLTSARADG